MAEITLLKLGGSLITDKTRPYTARPDKLADLAGQILRARAADPRLKLVLGHGSGSFGHAVAEGTGLRLPPNAPQLARDRDKGFWHKFAEVGYQASALNRLVMGALRDAGVPSIALSPAASVTAWAGRVLYWDLTLLRAALEAGLVPVVYGDVAFDQARGGTILSTEDLFVVLAHQLHPRRILLAGLEAAVWADFPVRSVRAERITPESLPEIETARAGSHGSDVTGGMASKVRQMLELVQKQPGLSVQIFSGEEPGNVERALAGEVMGSFISAA
jgi:isopentenyl phosphate kinase